MSQKNFFKDCEDKIKKANKMAEEAELKAKEKIKYFKTLENNTLSLINSDTSKQ